MASDPEAFEAVDGVALHWYSDYIFPPSLVDDLHNKYPDKLILYTETSVNGNFGSGTVVLGSWNRANGYIYNIVENIENWSNAYLDWNIALDSDGGPTLSFGVDAPVIVNKTSGEFYKQPMFYAMGHVSKFIPPGAIRVQVISNQNDTTIKDKQQDSGRDTLREFISSIKIQSEKAIAFSNLINVPQVVRCLATSNPDDSFTVLLINTKNESAEVVIQDPRVGQVSLSVEENSINTFVYWP